jgi:hypothetical protein
MATKTLSIQQTKMLRTLLANLNDVCLDLCLETLSDTSPRIRLRQTAAEYLQGQVDRAIQDLDDVILADGVSGNIAVLDHTEKN